MQTTAGQAISSRLSSTFRRKAVALQKLEEEQAIRLDILNRKYLILDSIDDGGDDGKQSSVDYSLQMASKVQSKSSTGGKFSPKSSYKVVTNARSSDRLEATTGQSKPTVFLKDVSINPAFLPTNSIPNHQQPSEFGLRVSHPTPNIKPKVEFALKGLQSGDSRNTSRQLQGSNVTYGQFGLPTKSRVELTGDVQQSTKDFDLQRNPPIQRQKNFGYDSSDVYGQRHNTISFGKNVPKNDEHTVTFSFESENIRNVCQPSTNVDTGCAKASIHRSSDVRHGDCSHRMCSTKSNFDVSGLPHFTCPSQLPQTNFNYGPKAANGFTDKRSEGVAPLTSLTESQIAARFVFEELPEFNGKYEDWPIFLSAFQISTEACGYSCGENLNRLQRCLKGEAAELVRDRLLHPNSVPGVMDTLQLMFGRPNVIIYALLDKINETSPPKENDLRSLIQFAISVQNLCGTIESSGNLEYLQNPILLQTLSDKLPTDIRLKWAYYKYGTGGTNLSIMGNWLYHLATVASDILVQSSDAKIDEKDISDICSNGSSESDQRNSSSDGEFGRSGYSRLSPKSTSTRSASQSLPWNTPGAIDTADGDDITVRGEIYDQQESGRLSENKLVKLNATDSVNGEENVANEA